MGNMEVVILNETRYPLYPVQIYHRKLPRHGNRQLWNNLLQGNVSFYLHEF